MRMQEGITGHVKRSSAKVGREPRCVGTYIEGLPRVSRIRRVDLWRIFFAVYRRLVVLGYPSNIMRVDEIPEAAAGRLMRGVVQDLLSWQSEVKPPGLPVSISVIFYVFTFCCFRFLRLQLQELRGKRAACHGQDGGVGMIGSEHPGGFRRRLRWGQ